MAAISTRPPLRGELDGIGQQVQQDLLAGTGIGGQRQGAVRQGLDQGDGLFFGAPLRQLEAAVHGLAQIHFARIELEFSGLDLGQVQDVGHQIEQMDARFVDQGDIFDIAAGQGAINLVLHDVRKADDGVQRRAQFMAHIGQEFRLDAIGGFRGFLRHPAFHQRLFQLHALQPRRRETSSGRGRTGRSRPARSPNGISPLKVPPENAVMAPVMTRKGRITRQIT